MGELISFLIVIGIIIFIHESGHFSMAKLFKIPVAVFSLGFGPKLFGFRHKETEYKISAIPMGGYVKIHGMEDQEAAPDDPNSFYNRPRYQRFLVLFMGVGFNFVLALVLLTGVFMHGREVSVINKLEPRIGIVRADSPAQEVGLQPGDLILSMNDESIKNWQQANIYTLIHPGEKVAVRIRRGSEILVKEVVFRKEGVNGLGYLGAIPEIDVLVSALNKGMPAEQAGIRKGDIIRSVNGVPIREPKDLVQAVQNSKGLPLTVQVSRRESGAERQMEFTLKPRLYVPEPGFWDKLMKRKPQAPERLIIGVVPGEPTVRESLSFVAALRESVEMCAEQARLNAYFIGRLFQGKLSLKSASGPFQIADMSQAARSSGFSTFLLFIGTMSFNIGIINLLPIPALDGGHIFFLLVEGVIRREISIKWKERVTVAGFAFLICVMLVVLYYDVLKMDSVQRVIENFGKTE